MWGSQGDRVTSRDPGSPPVPTRIQAPSVRWKKTSAEPARWSGPFARAWSPC